MFVCPSVCQGCREGRNHFQRVQPHWVARTNRDYGYSKMTVHNNTHLTFLQISDDKASKQGHSFQLPSPVLHPP